MPQLIEGKTEYVQGSGKKPYELKNVGGVYSCSCPAWRNQSVPIDKRTCKHLRSFCGSASEDARIGSSTVVNQAGTTTGHLQTQKPNVSVASSHEGKVIRADAQYAQMIVDRAAAEGRKLRPDEKAKISGPPVLLAHKFDSFKDLDPTGWWWSEKLDGVRAYWDGSRLISRQGNVFHAPEWFKAALPKDAILDGELWMGRQMFQKTISIVKRLDWGEDAKKIKYVLFDVPSRKNEIFEARLNAAINYTIAANVPHIQAHPHQRVESRKHLFELLKEYEALGAEGLMIRKPGSLYEEGRSSTLLKVKPFKDGEAVVIGHEPGKGRHKGVMGSCVVRLPSGVEFNVGTGFTDQERRNPPEIGATITFRYTELTEDGKPKCASFVCVRNYEG
jgi:DNA ligase-1